MKILMGCKGSPKRKESDGFTYLIRDNLRIMKHEGKFVKHDIRPPQKIGEKELHFGMQDEEYLSTYEKNLNEHFEKELDP